MFEHIHLLSGPEEVYMKEDTTDPLYRTFQREIRMCCRRVRVFRSRARCVTCWSVP